MEHAHGLRISPWGPESGSHCRALRPYLDAGTTQLHRRNTNTRPGNLWRMIFQRYSLAALKYRALALGTLDEKRYTSRL